MIDKLRGGSREGTAYDANGNRVGFWNLSDDRSSSVFFERLERASVQGAAKSLAPEYQVLGVWVTPDAADWSNLIAMTLGEFVAENEFTRDEVDSIVEGLATEGEYQDGGGAAPVWQVCIVTQDDQIEWKRAFDARHDAKES